MAAFQARIEARSNAGAAHRIAAGKENNLRATSRGDIAATKAKLNLDDFWLTSFAGVATTHLQARMAKEVRHSAEEHPFGAFLE
jgi:hypothetical protein